MPRSTSTFKSGEQRLQNHRQRQRGTIFENPCPKSESIVDKLIDLFSKR